MEYFLLPIFNVVGAAVNFGMILVAGRPVFSIPFKTLKNVVETRELIPSVMKWQTKKVAS
jgi:hypothetical protein